LFLKHYYIVKRDIFFGDQKMTLNLHRIEKLLEENGINDHSAIGFAWWGTLAQTTQHYRYLVPLFNDQYKAKHSRSEKTPFPALFRESAACLTKNQMTLFFRELEKGFIGSKKADIIGTVGRRLLAPSLG